MILYFIPEGSDATPPEHCTTQRKVIKGPDSKSGTIYSFGPGKTGFHPGQQTWTAVDDYYIGCGDDVTPALLLRPEPIDGHYVCLEDGNDWLIPCARMFPAGTMLPESLILGPDGAWVTEILPRFARFSARAQKVWDAFTGDNEMDFSTASDIAAEALSINYYIGRHEISILRLFSTTNVMNILKAMVDYPTLMEDIKKKTQEDGSTSDGSAD